MPKKQLFQYPRRTQQDVKARIRRYEFDNEFKKALYEAHKKNPEDLCEILRSSEPLSDEHRAGLADLIGQRLQPRNKKGRPRGSTLRSPTQEMEGHITYLARRKLALLRKQNGGKALPKGTIKRVIMETADHLGEIFGGDVPELKHVNFDIIQNNVKRGMKPKSASR